MTDADCFKAVRKLARANAKLLRQQRVLEADLIDAQLTILKQQAQLEAAAITNAGAKDAAAREVAARRELDAERAARADDALQAAQRLHDREAQLRHEVNALHAQLGNGKKPRAEVLPASVVLAVEQ